MLQDCESQIPEGTEARSSVVLYFAMYRTGTAEQEVTEGLEQKAIAWRFACNRCGSPRQGSFRAEGQRSANAKVTIRHGWTKHWRPGAAPSHLFPVSAVTVRSVGSPGTNPIRTIADNSEFHN